MIVVSCCPVFVIMFVGLFLMTFVVYCGLFAICWTAVDCTWFFAVCTVCGFLVCFKDCCVFWLGVMSVGLDVALCL